MIFCGVVTYEYLHEKYLTTLCEIFSIFIRKTNESSLMGLIHDFSEMITQIIESCLDFFDNNFEKKSEVYQLLELCYIKTDAYIAE